MSELQMASAPAFFPGPGQLVAIAALTILMIILGIYLTRDREDKK